jgi:hypothetical protein
LKKLSISNCEVCIFIICDYWLFKCLRKKYNLTWRNIFFEKARLYKTQYDGLTSRSNNQLIQHIYISFHIIILLILLLYCSCLWSRNCSPFRSTWVHTWFLVGFVLLDL